MIFSLTIALILVTKFTSESEQPGSLKNKELEREKVTQKITNALEQKRKNGQAKIVHRKRLVYNNFFKLRSRANNKRLQFTWHNNTNQQSLRSSRLNCMKTLLSRAPVCAINTDLDSDTIAV